jgi:hypothetical protein
MLEDIFERKGTNLKTCAFQVQADILHAGHSKSDICLLCHHLKAHHFTDKDGDKYCDDCECRGLGE